MWRFSPITLNILTMRSKPIVALIYDFDGTLSPGNMQEFGFIQAIGKKPQEFWQESDNIAVGQDASNILSYMKLMFDEAKKAGIKLRREDFKRFGASVELFNGVKEWFKMINDYGKSKGVKIEHYINSSGLAEMIEHNKLDTLYDIPLTVELEKTGEPIEKILSLEGAFNKLSDWIGDNSSYTIHSVDLGYYILQKDLTGKPVWRIVATNNNDKQDYIFEIDCVTEKVGSREKKVY